MRSMTKVERGWARAALGAIYPSGACDALPMGVCEFDVEGFLDDLFQRIPLQAVLGLRVAVWIVALAPVFLLGRVVTIVRLSEEERQAVVARLLSSTIYSVRQLVVALKATGGLFYGGVGAVRAAVLGDDEAPALREPLVQLRLGSDRVESGGGGDVHASL